jgi:hypothetical protein
MTKVRLTKGKFAGISACADARGVIAALAMDQRGSLQKMLAGAMPAGRAAGMRTVAARYGYLGAQADVSLWHADLHVDSPQQLLKWLTEA